MVAGTTSTYAPVRGIREDLEDVIWDLFPMDTWALTTLDTTDATSTFHEWLNDSLLGATANRQLEGDDASYTTVTPAVRMGNYCQISRKTFIISGTTESVKKAGRKSELARQAMKQMRELKRDMEQAIIGNQRSSAGDAASARSCGSMESWIATTDHGGNGLRSTSTSANSTIGFSSGVVTAPTDAATTASLTATMLTNTLFEAWNDGGDPSVILLGAAQKAVVDSLTSQATRFVDVDKSMEVPILTSASVYVSDFGRHTLILSRYIRANLILCIDPEYWAIAYLRRPFMQTLAQTGDAEKRMILSEFTLVARNPDSSAKMASLT